MVPSNTNVEETPTTAVVVGDDGPPTPETIALLVRSGVAVHEARRSRPNLDDLFAQLTEETG